MTTTKIILVDPDWVAENIQTLRFHTQAGTLESFKESETARMQAANAVSYFGLDGDTTEPEGENVTDLSGQIERAKITDLRATTGSETGNFARQGKVAFIPLVGAMSKRSYWSYWGGYTRGTLQVAADIREANADPDITGIVMYVDTPGGSVDGTELLHNEVRDSKKPIIAVVSGMCCSAGMWAVAAAHKIYTTSNQDYVGSIGVYTMHGDYSKLYEEFGIKITVITAEGSTEKVIGSPYEPLSPEHEDKIRGKLTEVRTDFIAAVTKGRGDSIKNPKDKDNPLWTGAVFHAKEARRLGITDGMVRIEAAILEAHRAGRRVQRESSNFKNSDKMADSMFDGHLKETKTKATGPVTLSADKANALDNLLDEQKATIIEQGTKIETLTAERDEAKGKVSTLTADLETSNGKVSTLEAANTKLKAEAANAPKGDNAEAVQKLTDENAALKLKIEGREAVEAVAAVEADPEKGIEAVAAVEAVEAVEGLEAKVARLTGELETAKAANATLTGENATLKQFKENATSSYNQLQGQYNALQSDKDKQAAKLDGEGKAKAENDPGQKGERLSMDDYEKLQGN